MAQHIEQDGPPLNSGTLGAVLYADRPTSLISEKGWLRLVQSIAAGDQLALHALYARAHRLVFTLLMRRTDCRATAEELTLDVFHEVWRQAHAYDAKHATVLGWIMNHARARIIDSLPAAEQGKKPAAPHGHEPLPPAVSALKQQRSEVLRRVLAVLTPGERQAIETAFFSELTHAEVAARTNQTPGTIKTRIRSGLHKLRLALAAEAKKQ